MINEPGQILVGVVVTLVLGCGVGTIMDLLIPRPDRPKALKEEVWNAMTQRVQTGKWIGLFERLVSLIAFWIPAYAILGGWLAFKVAAKWETWKNIVQVPASLKGVSELAWYQGRIAYGSWLFSRFLVGTSLSVLVGAIGAYCGKNSVEIFKWLGSFAL
jgi:hypothetical protein